MADDESDQVDIHDVSSMLEVKPKAKKKDAKRDPDVEMDDPAPDQNMVDDEITGRVIVIESMARKKTTSKLAEKDDAKKATGSHKLNAALLKERVEALEATEGADMLDVPARRQSNRLSSRSGSSGRGSILNSKRMKAPYLRQITDKNWNHQVGPHLVSE
jgi:hypothetical protein